jgi:hypothetical protein
MRSVGLGHSSDGLGQTFGQPFKQGFFAQHTVHHVGQPMAFAWAQTAVFATKLGYHGIGGLVKLQNVGQQFGRQIQQSSGVHGLHCPG